MSPRARLACALLAVLVLAGHASADDACSVERYRSALDRKSVCSEERAVLDFARTEVLRSPNTWRADVPDALRRLRDVAALDGALDRAVRAALVGALSRELSRQPALASTDAFLLSGGTDVEGCGCVYAALRMPSGPICFRLADTPPRGDACRERSMQVVTFAATPAGVRHAVRHEAYFDGAWAGLTALNKDARRAEHHALAESERQWHRYRRGYFQLPWELALNGWLERKGALRACHAGSELGPCRVQYVLLHPLTAVGVQLRGDRDGKVTRTAVATLGIDVLGAVAYTRGFRHYLGASAALGFDNLTFDDPRLGLTLHVTKYLQLSALAGVRRSSRGDATILVGGNLVGWLHGMVE